MRVVVVTPPDPVVSLDEAKAHLRVDTNDDDALIESVVAAATGHIDGPDGWLGRAVGSQMLEARFDTFDTFDREPCLPYPPIVELISIKWIGADRQPHVGDLADVQLLGDVVVPNGSAPWTGLYVGREALRIQYRAGYAALPPAIRAAILLMTDDLYRNRGEAVIGAVSTKVAMLATVDALLAPFRVWR